MLARALVTRGIVSACEKTSGRLSFAYVCPEPVLANVRCLVYKLAHKSRFLTSRKLGGFPAQSCAVMLWLAHALSIPPRNISPAPKTCRSSGCVRRRIEYQQTHTYARTHTVPDMLEEEEEEEASRSSLSRRRTQESYVVSES